MKKIYIVRQPFFSKRLGNFGYGQFVPEYQLPLLTHNEKKHLDEIKFSMSFSVFDYGMIFLSTELPLPEDMHPEETYEQMQCRILEEMNYCCAGENNKPFLNNKEND